MSTKIEILADDIDTANAVSAAVELGLQQAGFLNVTSETVFANGAESLLDVMRSTAPELFNTDIEINAVAVVNTEMDASGESEEPVDPVEAAEDADSPVR